MNSTRLPGKMLLELGGETLIARAYRLAVDVFGADHVIVAIPESDQRSALADELTRINARWVAPDATENDVLKRFWIVAHTYRWAPESLIVRWTPDDPFKDAESIRRVIAGERLPVELSCEVFALAALDAAHRTSTHREHLTHALFPVAPPKPPAGQVWTIDTEDDYLAALEIVEGGKKAKRAKPERVTA